jgi:hypothetical protein
MWWHKELRKGRKQGIKNLGLSEKGQKIGKI